MTFSINSAIQENYARYRQRGDLETALGNLAAMADEKRQAAADVQFLNWRYILFKWNDSDDEMNLARRREADLGVDRLTWEITDHPEKAFSRRFVPGSPNYAVIECEVWDDNNLGNAIPNATPRARIDVRRPMPGLPLIWRSKRQLHLETEVRNLSSHTRSRRKHRTGVGWFGSAHNCARRTSPSRVATTLEFGCQGHWALTSRSRYRSTHLRQTRLDGTR